MNGTTRFTLRQRRGLLKTGAAALLVFGSLGAWLNFGSSNQLNGFYHSLGEVQLSNGEIIEVSNDLHIDNGRFHATTRQGNAVLETFGALEYGRQGHYRLRVEDGKMSGLANSAYDELAFNLLYGRNRGSTLNLRSLDNCLYNLETRQLYCTDTLLHQQ